MSTADRLLSILSLFTQERPGWTVEEVAETTGLGVSTAYRYIRSLNDAGLIVSLNAGRYVLGPAIIEYDRLIRQQDPLIVAARPVMDEVAARAGIPGVILLCRYYRGRVMCVHQAATAERPAGVSYERGRPMPLFRGAASKIILAHLPSRTVKTYHARHAAEMAAAGLGGDWDAVKRALRQIREAGVCAVDAELDAGVLGVGAPVFGPDGEVIASLSGAFAETDVGEGGRQRLSELLRLSARQIDAGLRTPEHSQLKLD